MDPSRTGRGTVTSSETTLKNSDFFYEPSTSVSNTGRRASDVRRSSRSESGTVINKTIGGRGTKGSKTSSVHHENGSKAEMYQSNNRFSNTIDVDVTHKSAERVTDIIDPWPGSDNNDNGRHRTKASTLDPSLLSDNPLINVNGHVHNPVDNHESCPVVKINVVKVGIYGWRKKFLYILILFITLSVFVNAALLYWITQLLNINQDGIGSLKIDPNLIAVDGDTFIGGQLHAKNIRSQVSNRIKIKASDLISIHGEDAGNEQTRRRREVKSGEEQNEGPAILSMDGKSVEAFAEQFIIRSGSDRKIVFLVDPNQVIVSSDTLRINNSMAIQLNKSLVTPSIRGLVSNDLDIICPTRQIRLSAPKSVQLQSSAGSIQLHSLLNIKFEASKKGKIVLDSGNIHLKNVPITKWSSSSRKTSSPVRGTREMKDVAEEAEQAENLKVDKKSSEGSGDDDQSLTSKAVDENGSTTAITYRDDLVSSNKTSILDSGGSLMEDLEDGSGQENKTGPENPMDKKKEEEEKDEVYQLCVCSKNGRIFMAPADSSCSLPSTTSSSSSDPDADSLICS